MTRAAENDKSARLYLGVDVGGTKVLAAVVKPSGKIVARRRRPTPRGRDPRETLAAIAEVMSEALAEGAAAGSVKGVGLAIPGVVDPDAGRIVVTPNMNLSGLTVTGDLGERFGVPVALGNDVNLGTLAEKWLGSARSASSAVGIFVGTGIGGGIIQGGSLVAGCRQAAGEIGHMVMQIGGPACGCGGRGCLEALASRTAIERDIRQAVADGEQTVLTTRGARGLKVIKSGRLRDALEQGDELVVRIMTRAAEVLAQACLNVRHLLDPEVIILGGGVIEACGWFVVPIVERAVAADPLPAAGPGGKVVVASLGDDAVVLGAAALAQQAAGEDPIAGPPPPEATEQYPPVSADRPGEITVGEKTYRADVYIRADGKVKRRDKLLAKLDSASTGQIDRAELERVCKGAPATLIVGTRRGRPVRLTRNGRDFLRWRGIAFELLPTAEAAAAYNAAAGRKAVIMLVE